MLAATLPGPKEVIPCAADSSFERIYFRKNMRPAFFSQIFSEVPPIVLILAFPMPFSNTFCPYPDSVPANYQMLTFYLTYAFCPGRVVQHISFAVRCACPRRQGAGTNWLQRPHRVLLRLRLGGGCSLPLCAGTMCSAVQAVLWRKDGVKFLIMARSSPDSYECLERQSGPTAEVEC